MLAPARARIAVLAASASLAAATVGAGSFLAAPAASAATVRPCGNTSLAVTHTPADGATGHGSFVLLFRNVSHRTCSLDGYPGLDALNGKGHVLAHARRKLQGFAGGASAVRLITVKPGKFASATVEWLNFNPVTSGSCRFSKSIATTPANTTHTVHFTQSVGICGLQIHPTVGGTSGHARYAAAQRWWIRGAASDSAHEGLYWSRARTALTGSAFHDQRAELTQLIALPDADQTPAQNAAYKHDVADLDAFFATPRLYR